MLKKVGSLWHVLSKTGKILGKHKLKRDAQKQLSAIEISKAKKKRSKK